MADEEAGVGIALDDHVESSDASAYACGCGWQRMVAAEGEVVRHHDASHSDSAGEHVGVNGADELLLGDQTARHNLGGATRRRRQG